MLFLNYETIIDPVLRDLRKLVAGIAGIKTGDRVLDVCCGTGAQVLEYARMGINSTGVDNNPDMIKTALKNRAKDNLFDYVSVSFAIHDKENPLRDEIITEMKRVVKEKGTLVFIDFKVPLPSNIYGLAVKAIEFMAGGSHYRGFRQYHSDGGLDTILKKHDLRLKSSESLKKGIALVATAEKT